MMREILIPLGMVGGFVVWYGFNKFEDLLNSWTVSYTKSVNQSNCVASGDIVGGDYNGSAKARCKHCGALQ